MSATQAIYPHDLDDRLPGLTDLRRHTLGDAAVTVVILDGDPDLERTCFRGSQVTKHFPFWHARAELLTSAQHALYRSITERNLEPEELDRQLAAAFAPAVLTRIMGDRHATHITSVIAGQPGSPVQGLAPGCRVIVVPLNEAGDAGEFMSPLNLARSFDLARELGADIIHCAVCVPTQTDQAHQLLARAVRACVEAGILIVAPAGNDGGDCRCVPAVLPGTLAVGALKDDGRPFKFSNWGGAYATGGIMAPGQRILVAQPMTEQPIREKGTSLAAPIVTGVAALLMSRQLQLGQHADGAAIRAALCETARPCDPAIVDEPERCLRGVIDLPAAVERLFGPRDGVVTSSNRARLFAGKAGGAVAAIKPATAHSGLVYALGRLSFDLGTPIGRQALAQRMARGVAAGELRGANPEDASDLVDYLDRNPTERRCIIWTLEMDGGPISALDPRGPFAEAIYEVLLHLLAGQLLPRDAVAAVERVSIPARRAGRVVELLSGAKVPVLTLADVRGIYGWQLRALVDDAVASVGLHRLTGDDSPLREAMADFLERIYHHLGNDGTTSRDRAMNFAATNCVQAASVFARAIAEGRQLETIAVSKSPVCRMHSDCWELQLTFHDPDDGRRASRVFSFTLDVSDVMPVTVGVPRSWTIRRA